MIDIKPEVIRLFAESKYRRKHPNIANSVNGNISDVEKESMKGAKFFKEKTLGIFLFISATVITWPAFFKISSTIRTVLKVGECIKFSFFLIWICVILLF